MKRTRSTACFGENTAVQQEPSPKKYDPLDGVFTFDPFLESELPSSMLKQSSSVLEQPLNKKVDSGKTKDDSPNSVLAFFGDSFAPIHENDEKDPVRNQSIDLTIDEEPQVEVQRQTQFDPYLYRDGVYQCDQYIDEFRSMYYRFLLEKTSCLTEHMNHQDDGEADLEWGQFINLDQAPDEAFVLKIMDLLDGVDDVRLTQMVHYIAETLSDSHESKFDRVKAIFSQWRATCSPETQRKVDDHQSNSPSMFKSAENKPSELSKLLSQQSSHHQRQSLPIQVLPRCHDNVLDEIMSMLNADFLRNDAQSRVFVRYHLHNIELSPQDVLVLRGKKNDAIDLNGIMDNREQRAEANNAAAEWVAHCKNELWREVNGGLY